jgi:NAD(P)-dependent dehydrogenase (short-subunit alcohol dehydrogenase family)
MDHSNNLVVITGATRGLGQAMVVEFVRRGWTVAGIGRSMTKVNDLNRTWGAPHWFQVVNVANDAAVAAWAQRVLTQLGPPDFLLNNAGLINRNAPLWKVPAVEFSEVIDTNLKGVANVIRHFAPAMVECGQGVVVNFSSGWGRTTNAEVAPYCCTKWGVEGLTQAFAQELPKGMAAVALNPGIIDTEMLRSCYGASAQHYPSPEAWAKHAVPFILSLNGKHNGQSLDMPA